MSLDGLRAWIGEVERKLGMRTRVFLVLALIAIGGAGAAVYLAIDTRENAVSESDVQALQEKLEARIAAGAAGAGGLEAEPEGVPPEGEGTPGAGSGAGAGDAGGEAGSGGAAPSGSGGGGSHSAGGSGKAGGASGGEAENGTPDTNKGASKNGGSSSHLQELLEQTQEANAKAEREAKEKK